MNLDELTAGIPTIERRGDLTFEINSIEYDSRKIKPGCLFMAVRGFKTDGNTFIGDAVKMGASAVVTDEPASGIPLPMIIVPDARKAMALIADRFYSSPQNSLIMTGITGTNGKTTTSYMVKSIFEAGCMSCGLIGTIRHLVGNETVQSANTTPEAPDIHSFLSRMVQAGQSACTMEISSHALALSRVYGIRFRAVAFTNLTRDHLDFHGSFESYLDAKSILFSSLSGDSTAVINRDDPYSQHIINVSRSGKILTFGFSNESDLHPLSLEMDSGGSRVELATPTGEMNFHLSMPGRFNVSNAMAACGIGLACGFPKEVVSRGLENLKSVPGRYQTINAGQDFTVIVDYAHAPDALERILATTREISKGRVISVFGCGGDRDRGKRSQMGEISTRLADYTVVTSDNPRTEDPDGIIAEIMQGIPNGAAFEVIPDRENAIIRALELASSGDVVVIAGKGHEDYQIIGTKKNHFDDAETAYRILKAMK